MKLHYKVVCVIKLKYNINSRHQSSYDGDIVGILYYDLMVHTQSN